MVVMVFKDEESENEKIKFTLCFALHSFLIAKCSVYWWFCLLHLT